MLGQEAATERAERHAQMIIKAAEVATGPTPMDAGPMPYGPDEDIDVRPDGTYDPYQIAVISGIGDVPTDQLEAAIQRVGAVLRRSGWIIGDLTPAAIGRDSTRLTGANLADGHTFIIEALHDLNRLVINVTSPPYRHPA